MHQMTTCVSPQGITVPKSPAIKKETFTFIDLFAGIGGFRKGLEAAGGKCVFSCEKDKFARETYAANYKTDHPFAEDIKQVQAADIPEHDMLVGGFPCQAFSLAGRKAGLKDAQRGNLFFDIVRILAYQRPRCFILENVKNLIHHNDGRTFEIMRLFLEDDLGYHIQWRVINAKAFVPQNRFRVFIVGFLEETEFDFDSLEIPKDSGITLDDIMEDDQDFEEYTISDRLWSTLQEHKRKHKAAGNGFGYRLADPKGISCTMLASYASDGSSMMVPQEGKNPRKFTPLECSRLMGFDAPDGSEFQFPVSNRQAYKQLGNAVVPQVAEFLAKEVAKAL